MIYFVQLDSGAIKIGFTDNLKARLSSLKTHHESSVSLLATIEGNLEREKEIHERFAHLRLGRPEQFRPTSELMEFIGKPLLVSVEPDCVEIQPGSGESNHPTVQKSYRLAPETVERIEQLSKLWSQVRGPLSAARVLDETVKRVHEQETKKEKRQ